MKEMQNGIQAGSRARQGAVPLLLAAGVALVAALGAQAGGALDRAWLKGVTDRNPLFYRPGEKMVFTLALADVEGPLPEGLFLDWKRSGDDGLVETGRVAMTGAPFVYETKIDRPGFVRLEANVVGADGKRAAKAAWFDGGAGADVDALRSEPEPKDFDAFWARQAARLDRVPLKAEQVEIPCDNAKVRRYAVRVDCAGLRPVTGYLSVPKGAGEGRTYPCRLETHGYSGDNCVHKIPPVYHDDEIVFNVNAHGLKLPEFGATEADTKMLRFEIRSNGREYAFDPEQNADPETAYFNGMVLRVKRALQYLKTQKGWNGKDLIASGGSQGGLQTIWAAGCGEGVTFAESWITWCCDMYTSGKLRVDPSRKLASGGWYIGWTDAMGYYDAANFAKRIPATCHTFISRAGLGDYCCPPTGLAKLWNNIPGNKKICWVQGSTHGYTPPDHDGRDVVREEK